MKIPLIYRFYLYKISESVLFSFSISAFFFQSRGIDLSGLLILESMYSCAIVLMELPTGLLSDILGKKKSLHIANILRLASHIGFILSSNFYIFLIFHFIYGMCVSFFSGSYSALLHDFVESSNAQKTQTERENIYYQYEGTSNMLCLLSIVGSSFLGAYVSSFDPCYPYILNAFFSIVSLVSLSMLNLKSDFNIETRSTRQFISNSYTSLRRSPELISILLFAAYFFFIFRVQFFLSQNFLMQIKFNSFQAGSIISISMIFAAVASKMAWTLEKKIGPSLLLAVIAILFTLPALILGITQSQFGIISIFILFIGRGLYLPTLRKMVLFSCDADKKATFLSVMNLGGYFLFSVLSPLAGSLNDLHGSQFSFLILFGFGFLGILFILRSFLRLKKIGIQAEET